MLVVGILSITLVLLMGVPAGLLTSALLSTTFTLVAIGLMSWSVLVRNLSMRLIPSTQSERRRTLEFFTNGFVSLVSWTLWLSLLLDTVLSVTLPLVERWFVSLGVAWMLSPFTALILTHTGLKLNAFFDRSR